MSTKKIIKDNLENYIRLFSLYQEDAKNESIAIFIKEFQARLKELEKIHDKDTRKLNTFEKAVNLEFCDAQIELLGQLKTSVVHSPNNSKFLELLEKKMEVLDSEEFKLLKLDELSFLIGVKEVVEGIEKYKESFELYQHCHPEIEEHTKLIDTLYQKLTNTKDNQEAVEEIYKQIILQIRTAQSEILDQLQKEVPVADIPKAKELEKHHEKHYAPPGSSSSLLANVFSKAAEVINKLQEHDVLVAGNSRAKPYEEHHAKLASSPFALLNPDTMFAIIEDYNRIIEGYNQSNPFPAAVQPKKNTTENTSQHKTKARKTLKYSSALQSMKAEMEELSKDTAKNGSEIEALLKTINAIEGYSQNNPSPAAVQPKKNTTENTSQHKTRSRKAPKYDYALQAIKAEMVTLSKDIAEKDLAIEMLLKTIKGKGTDFDFIRKELKELNDYRARNIADYNLLLKKVAGRGLERKEQEELKEIYENYKTENVNELLQLVINREKKHLAYISKLYEMAQPGKASTLSLELALAEEKYALWKETILTTCAERKKLPHGSLNDELEGLVDEFLSLEEEIEDTFRTKAETIGKLDSEPNLEAARITGKIAATLDATSRLKGLNERLSENRARRDPAIDEIKEDRDARKASLEEKLASVEELITATKTNPAYKGEVEMAEFQTKKAKKSIEYNIKTFGVYPRVLEPKKRDIIDTLEAIKTNLENGIKAVNIDYLNRIEKLDIKIKQLQKIKDSGLVQTNEFSRFDNIVSNFKALKPEGKELTSILNIDSEKLNKIELRIQEQEERAKFLIQEIFESELQVVCNLIEPINKNKTYYDNEGFKLVRDDAIHQIEDIRLLKFYGKVDTLDLHARLEIIRKDLNTAIKHVNMAFLRRLDEVKTHLNELKENRAQKGLVDETDNLQRELEDLLKPEAGALICAIDISKVNEIDQKITEQKQRDELVEQGVDLERKDKEDLLRKREADLKDSRRTSDEVKTINDMIKLILIEKNNIGLQNPDKDMDKDPRIIILNQIRSKLVTNRDEYLELKIPNKITFITQSLGSIRETLKTNSNLHNLSYADANPLLIFLGLLLQPINLLIKKWNGETYRPRFFAKEIETNVATAAETARRELQQQLQQLREEKQFSEEEVEARAPVIQ